MRKRLFATMIVAVVVAFAGYNVYQSQNTNTLSDLALANVEALAQKESSGFDCRWADLDYTWCIKNGVGIGCPCYII